MYSENKIIPHKGIFPDLEKDVFLAPGSKIIGNVYIGSESSVWYNCVIRADVNYVRIGKKTNILSGIHCASPEYAAKAVKWGFDLVTVNSDVKLLSEMANHVVKKTRNLF